MARGPAMTMAAGFGGGGGGDDLCLLPPAHVLGAPARIAALEDTRREKGEAAARLDARLRPSKVTAAHSRTLEYDAFHSVL